MKKLLFLLVFIPLASFGQEDIERFKVYETTNIYTSLLLDTATGQIWQLQIGLTFTDKKRDDVDQIETILSDTKFARTLEDVTEEWNEDMKKWEENYNSKADSIVSVEDKGAGEIVLTDIDKDGMLSGPSIELYKKIISGFDKIKLIASGGVKNMIDVKKLSSTGCYAAIIGKAIYEKEIDLKEIEKYILGC